MKLKKIIIYNVILVFLIAIGIEAVCFGMRIFLDRNSVGFLVSYDSSVSKLLKNDCRRFKTHIILSHTHDTQNKCEVEGAAKVTDEFIYYESNKNNKRKLNILTLGGSTTDGYFYWLGNSKTWPYLLSKICNEEYQCNVINGGAGGYNSGQELLKYLIFSNQLNKLDFIISLNGINEINVPMRDLGKNLKIKYPFQSRLQYLISKEEKWIKQHKDKIQFFPNFMSFLNFYIRYDFNLGLNDFLDKEKIDKYTSKGIDENLEYNAQLWEKNINNLNALSNANGTKFINFIQPTLGLDHVKIDWINKNNDYLLYEEFKKSPLYYETNYIYKILIEKCQYINFCHDITKISQPAGNSDINIFNDARHHNENGNLIIAKEIFEVLKRQM